VCGCSTIGTPISHGHTWTHKTHHNSDLEEATTLPLIIFSMFGHGGYTQMSFCSEIPKLGVSKFPKLGLMWPWRPITFCANLRLGWGFKKSYSHCWEIFNNMWHTTCTQVNQSDYKLLVVGGQINNLIFGLFFVPCFVF